MVAGGVDIAKNVWNDMKDIFGGGDKKGDQIIPSAPKIANRIFAPTMEN